MPMYSHGVCARVRRCTQPVSRETCSPDHCMRCNYAAPREEACSRSESRAPGRGRPGWRQPEGTAGGDSGVTGGGEPTVTPGTLSPRWRSRLPWSPARPGRLFRFQGASAYGLSARRPPRVGNPDPSARVSRSAPYSTSTGSSPSSTISQNAASAACHVACALARLAGQCTGLPRPACWRMHALCGEMRPPRNESRIKPLMWSTTFCSSTKLANPSPSPWQATNDLRALAAQLARSPPACQTAPRAHLLRRGFPDEADTAGNATCLPHTIWTCLRPARTIPASKRAQRCR